VSRRNIDEKKDRSALEADFYFWLQKYAPGLAEAHSRCALLCGIIPSNIHRNCVPLCYDEVGSFIFVHKLQYRVSQQMLLRSGIGWVCTHSF